MARLIRKGNCCVATGRSPNVGLERGGPHPRVNCSTGTARMRASAQTKNTPLTPSERNLNSLNMRLGQKQFSLNRLSEPPCVKKAVYHSIQYALSYVRRQTSAPPDPCLVPKWARPADGWIRFLSRQGDGGDI